MRRKTDPLILALCAAWIFILGGLGVSAITQGHLSIGTRLGVSTSDGLSAKFSGVVLIGFALVGFAPPLHRSRFQKLAIATLVVLWLLGAAAVLLLALSH